MKIDFGRKEEALAVFYISEAALKQKRLRTTGLCSKKMFFVHNFKQNYIYLLMNDNANAKFHFFKV